MELDDFQIEPQSTIPTRESFNKWKEATEKEESEHLTEQLEQGKKELAFLEGSTVPLTKQIKKKYTSRNPYKFTVKVQMVFCEHLSILGRVTHAARAAGISPLTVKAMEKNSPEFAEMVGLAQMEYRDKVAAEVYRRAIEGWDEPVIGGRDRDRVVCHIRKFSDKLLELEAKRVDSGYREKQTLNVGQSGGVIVINQAPTDKEPWREKYNQAVAGPVVALASQMPKVELEGDE